MWYLNVFSFKSLIILFIYIYSFFDIFFLLCLQVFYWCFNSYFLQVVVVFLFFNLFNIFIKFDLFQSGLYNYYFDVFIFNLILFFGLLKIMFQIKGFLTSFQCSSFFDIYRWMFEQWYKDSIYHCLYYKDPILCFFFSIDFLYKFEYCSKKEIANNFKS